MATAQGSIDWYKQQGVDMVMVDDGQGNRYLTLRSNAQQDDTGAWRPLNYTAPTGNTAFDRNIQESKTLAPGNVINTGGTTYAGGQAYTRDQWAAKRTADNAAAAQALQGLGVDQATATRYAAATKDMTQNRGMAAQDIARRLGAMLKARQRTNLGNQYQKQGMPLTDARARASAEMPNQYGNWDLAMQEAAQLIPGGGSVSSTDHWIFSTAQGRAILEKFGLTGAGIAANSPAMLGNRGGTGWYEGQNYVAGRPVSEQDYAAYSGMTQDDLNKAALARRAAELRAVQGNTGANVIPINGRMLDDQGNVIVPGTAPRLGMPPTVPRMAPPAPDQATPTGGGTPSGWIIPYGPDSSGAITPPGVPPAPWSPAAGAPPVTGAPQPAPPAPATGGGAQPAPGTGAFPGVTPGAGAPPSGIQPQPMSLQVAELLAMLRSRIEGTPITAQDIMNSPEYQAQAGAIDFARESAQAQLRRALASRNMLRSTPAVQSLASSDAYYTAQEQALVPQMLRAATDRQQTGIRNISDLLNTVSGLESTAFDQGAKQAEFLRGVFESDRLFQEDVRRFGLDYAIKQAESDGRLAEAAQRMERSDAEFAEWRQMAPYRQRMAELDVATTELQNQVARLEAELAASPDVGLRAQKQLALQQARVQLQQAQAELALFNDPKVGEAAMRAVDMAHKYALAQKAGRESETKTAENDAVKALTSDWSITSSAAKAWLDFSANLEALGGTGTVSLPDVQELLKAYQSWSGITADDYNWLAYMAYSLYPGQDASRKLLSRYARRRPEASEPAKSSAQDVQKWADELRGGG